MPRFSANLSTMFQEHPFLDRFAAAREAGFMAVEFQFPYAFTVDEVAARVKENGLEVILFNLPPGDFAKGERGIACHPGRETEFRDGIATAIAYAKVTGCRMLNCLAGLRPETVSRDEASSALLYNLSVRRRPPGGERHPACDRTDQQLRHAPLLPQPQQRGGGSDGPAQPP